MIRFYRSIVSGFNKGKVVMNEAKILILLCVGIIILFSVGCIPLLTGIKKHTHSDGSVTEFITGVDLMVGANGTDTVENTRGIEPGKYTKQ